ncbi:hypothetical protein [Streptomyces capitiformicae]|uniref:Uncharacterized protein n=1 Tax=Streptomyces capitiformicae TaxID=2014920 RepID=A0A918ZEB8_9ACTN|nr:hypothetical protein [Streptomyces capitiformicae]GHE45155.1 hypothetical protein GCM10017771_65560 [Streptomyces capitiformicae]
MAVQVSVGQGRDEATAEYKEGVPITTVPVQEAKARTRTIPVRHI